MNRYAQDYYELESDRDIMRLYNNTDGLTLLRNAAVIALNFEKARFVTQVELETFKLLNERNRNWVWEILETPQGTLCLERVYISVHHDSDTVTIWDEKSLNHPRRYREKQHISTAIKPRLGHQRFYVTKGEARRALQRIVAINPRFRSTWELGVQVTKRQRDTYNALKYALYGDVVHFSDKSLVVARVCPTEVQFTDGTVMPILDVVKGAELVDTAIRLDKHGKPVFVRSAGLEWLSSDELAQIAYARIVAAIGSDRPIYVLKMGEVREYFVKGLDGSTVLFTDGTGMSIFDITKPEQGVCSVWTTTLGVCRALAYINGGAKE